MDNYVTLEQYRELMSTPHGDDLSEYVEYNGIRIYEISKSCVQYLKISFEVRADDSWIVTYPKAGTTWAQEIMSAVMHDGNIEELNKRHTMFRVPFMELCLPKSVRDIHNIPENYKIAENVPSPRVLKSHLPGQLLPPRIWEKSKVVYVIRNPKDLVVSYFYFTKMIKPEKKDQSFAEFFEEMMLGKGSGYGSWWDHYLFFWKLRHHPKILVLKFEDMKRDLRGNVEKISQFLGKNLSAEKLDAITEHCTFANMKKNPMTNPDSLDGSAEPAHTSFMRKGKVGDWKSHFTVAQNETMDALIREKFFGTGLTFDY